MGSFIAIDDVSKDFGSTRAVAGITASFDSGVIALVGRNGAGKTTLLNLISGVVTPTSGSVMINGHAAGHALAVGSVARQLDPGASMGHITRSRAQKLLNMTTEQAESMNGFLELFEVPRAKFGTLSRGNQMRFALSASFAMNTPILLLDEPFAGLDAIGVDALAGVLQTRRNADHVTLVATHQPSLVEDLFDRVVVIDLGRVLYDGSLESLISVGRKALSADHASQMAQLAAALTELVETARAAH